MPPIVMQSSLLGDPPVVSGDVVDRIEALLVERPDLRDSYQALQAAYWAEFDGLGDALKRPLAERIGEPAAADLVADLVVAFQQWFARHATSPKTIQNRAQEIQHREPALDARKDIRQWRDKQSRAGPVR